MADYVSSYYSASKNTSKCDYGVLNEDVSTDVCVIGAGFTGLSSALHLAEKGYRVVVLEANRVGFGASGRNGGQIVNAYSRDVDLIEKKYPQQAEALGNLIFEGGKIIRRLVKDYQIQCDLKEGGVFAAITEKHLKELRERTHNWQRYGNDQLQLLDKAELKKLVGSDRYVGGLLDQSGGHFHPLNLTLGEADAIVSLGGQIYEQSEVKQIVEGETVTVKTAQGSVHCQYLVVAGNAYMGSLVPELAGKTMPCGTQIIGTEVLSDAQIQSIIPSGYCVEDCNYLLDYFRITGDNRLIYGGGVVYGARDPANIEAIIRPKMLKTFPQLAGVKIDYHWTGNFLLTLSRMPQFGQLSQNKNIYYMQGYSGHGVTCTHLAGSLVSEFIHAKASKGFEAFAALPHYPFPGGHTFSIPMAALGATYYALLDRFGI